jgi:hypothetical protein
MVNFTIEQIVCLLSVFILECANSAVAWLDGQGEQHSKHEVSLVV